MRADCEWCIHNNPTEEVGEPLTDVCFTCIDQTWRGEKDRFKTYAIPLEDVI